MDQILQVASDALLGIGAFGAAAYCVVLARRLKRFNNLENGVGGAVAVLSAQVDDMTKTLDQAHKSAAHSEKSLTALTERAEASARKLELMMASLHDLPDAPKLAGNGIAEVDGSQNQVGPGKHIFARGEEELDAAWTAASDDREVDPPPQFASRRQHAAGGG